MTMLDAHQQKAVEALREFKRICNKYNLKYFLVAGSALGAIRHKGMIPWDDDIDVGMLYKDWYELREVISQELDPQFQYVDDTIEDTWPLAFGKILYERESCIDIFLLAKWTSNPITGYLCWNFRAFILALYRSSINYMAPIVMRPEWGKIKKFVIKFKRFLKKNILIPTRKIISRKYCLRLLRWNERRFENKKKTDWYINLYSLYPMKKELIKNEWIKRTSIVTYEGEQYTTFGDTDAYLTHLYGDYMIFPQKESRVKLHSEKFKKENQI